MKYDEKTGKPTPENRSDEIKLTMDSMNEVRKKTNGMNDKQFEICSLLADINVSLGLVVDMLGVLYGKIMKEDVSEEVPEEEGK